jgi:hypothetical protein
MARQAKRVNAGPQASGDRADKLWAALHYDTAASGGRSKTSGGSMRKPLLFRRHRAVVQDASLAGSLLLYMGAPALFASSPGLAELASEIGFGLLIGALIPIGGFVAELIRRILR